MRWKFDMTSLLGSFLRGWAHRNSFWARRRKLLCAILLFALPVAAQDPGQRPPVEQPMTPGRQVILGIEGRVVFGHDGANLAGVHVTLTDFRGSIRGTHDTRAGGTFSFRNLGPGRYTLTLSHPDFVEHKETVDLVFISHQGLVVSLVRSARGASPPSQSTVPAWALQIPSRAQKEFSKGLEALEREDVKGSVAHLQAAVELYPRFAIAYGALGAVHTSGGDTKAAEAAYEKALEIDETLSTAHLGLGNLYLAEKRYRDAEKHLLRALSLKPDDWRVQYGLGDLYWRAGLWARAEEKLRRAIELHGKVPRLYLLMINVLAEQEKYVETLATMENFLKLFPDDRFAKQVAQKRDLLRVELANRSASKEKTQP